MSYLKMAIAVSNENRDGVAYEINELNEIRSRVELCYTCTCGLYIVRLQGGCSVCNGALCAKCDGCLKSSHGWRHQKIEPIQVGDSLDVILDSLRKGQEWLRVRHKALFDNPGIVDLDQYTRGLDKWDGLEAALRQIHGYERCVLGEGMRCPEDSQPTCSSCVGSD